MPTPGRIPACTCTMPTPGRIPVCAWEAPFQTRLPQSSRRRLIGSTTSAVVSLHPSHRCSTRAGPLTRRCRINGTTRTSCRRPLISRMLSMPGQPILPGPWTLKCKDERVDEPVAPCHLEWDRSRSCLPHARLLWILRLAVFFFSPESLCVLSCIFTFSAYAFFLAYSLSCACLRVLPCIFTFLCLRVHSCITFLAYSPSRFHKLQSRPKRPCLRIWRKAAVALFHRNPRVGHCRAERGRGPRSHAIPRRLDRRVWSLG